MPTRSCRGSGSRAASSASAGSFNFWTYSERRSSLVITCASCGDDKNTLHVHHRYYRKDAEPWDYPAKALLTLCENCHAEITEGAEGRKESERLLVEALREMDVDPNDVITLVREIRGKAAEMVDVAYAFHCLSFPEGIEPHRFGAGLFLEFSDLEFPTKVCDAWMRAIANLKEPAK